MLDDFDESGEGNGIGAYEGYIDESLWMDELNNPFSYMPNGDGCAETSTLGCGIGFDFNEHAQENFDESS